ncbi:FAD-binding oxidoreductase [Aliiroseovarius sp. F47248L]|uniref:NAD(P)/FAD-dependent oxidoreductase n=1 Tax=Aliiroseovarius sp. F47248L TaxID=2926420 RepID=UPI001FF39670|nr:FAD-binding oxidoreductase [Aliiroseovarius sp. F47248L]MCK0137978.1 FAD-binding oxidoreductase [Aliiroseovarius sp. F47248L]
MHRRIYEDLAYSDAARAECIWPLPDQNWPALIGETTTDVAIIGGGYTGLSAALHLAKSGVDVTLLEAHVPGWGASGRNGGFCCIGGDKLTPSTIQKKYGANAAQAYFKAQRGAIDLVKNLITTHNIDADTHSDGEMQLAHRPDMLHALQAEREQWADHGINATLIPHQDLVSHGMSGAFYGGLHVPLGFALNPGKYVTGLAHAAGNAGAHIHAHSSVQSITRTDGSYKLVTLNGHLTAKKLILATNGYGTDGLPDWLTGRYLPLQSNILVTRPLSDDEISAQGWTTDLMAYDSRHLLHYFRLLPDRRFLFGARGNIRASTHGQAAMRARMRRDLAALFPAWSNVETPFFWSGLISLSRDLLPYAGPIGDWENAWAGMNYHGNGVAMGTWVGARLADMALGRSSALPVHTRALPRFPLPGLRRNYLYPAILGYRLKDGPPAA